MVWLSEHNQIQAFAAGLCAVSFQLFITSDNKTWNVSDEAADGKLLLVLAALFLLVWSCMLTLLAGTWRFKEFRLFQPFCGGTMFVFLQALGWTLLGFGVTLTLIACANITTIPAYMLTALGILGSFSHVLLTLSISLFKPVASIPRGGVGVFSRNGWLYLNAILAVGAFLIFTTTDVLGSHNLSSTSRVVLVRVSTGCMFLSVVATHLLGVFTIPGFRLLQPFEGGDVFVTLQALGWTFFGVMLDLIWAGVHDLGLQHGILTGIGFLGMCSALTLLSSLPTFQPPQSPHSPAPTIAYAGVRALPVTTLIVGSTFLLVALYFSFVVMFVIGQVPQMLQHVVTAHKQTVLLVFVVSVHLIAPAVQLAAAWIHKQAGFRFWQPLRGGFAFVCAQAFGWTLYGISTLTHALALFPSHISPQCTQTLISLAPLAFLAQSTIAVSVRYFSPVGLQATTHSDPMAVDGLSWYSKDLFVPNLLCVVAATFELIVETLAGSEAFHWLFEPLLFASAVIYILSPLLLHHAGYRRFSSYRLFQPFQGGDPFIVCQAVGWTLYGLGVLSHVVLLATKMNTGSGPGAGITVVSSAVSCLAHFLLCFSLFLYDETQHHTHTGEHVNVFGVRVTSWDAWGTSTGCADLRSVRTRLVQMVESLECAGKCVEERPKEEDMTRVILKHLLSGLDSEVASFLEVEEHRRANQLPPSQLRARRLGMAINMTSLVFSLILFLVAELLRSYTMTLPAVVSFTAGMALSGAGAMFCHLYASYWIDGYQVFQPCIGGIRFVVLQGVAWTLLGAGLVLGLAVYLSGDATRTVPLLLLAVGLLFCVAHLLLILSTLWFTPPPRNSRNKSSSASLMFSALALLNFVIADAAMLNFGPSFPVLPILLMGFCAVLVSVPLTYCLAYHRRSPHSPTHGISMILKHFSTSHPLLQIIGLTLWAFTLLLALAVLVQGCCVNVAALVLFSCPCFTSAGFVGVIAQMLITVALRWSSNDKSLVVTGHTLAQSLWDIIAYALVRLKSRILALSPSSFRSSYAITFIGDSGVGKSRVISTLASPQGHQQPPLPNNMAISSTVAWRGLLVNKLAGTSSPDLARRALSAWQSSTPHVYCLCYSPDVEGSLDHVVVRWLPCLLASMRFDGILPPHRTAARAREVGLDSQCHFLLVKIHSGSAAGCDREKSRFHDLLGAAMQRLIDSKHSPTLQREVLNVLLDRTEHVSIESSSPASVEGFGSGLVVRLVNMKHAQLERDMFIEQGWTKGAVTESLNTALPEELVREIGMWVRADWDSLPSRLPPRPLGEVLADVLRQNL